MIVSVTALMRLSARLLRIWSFLSLLLLSVSLCVSSLWRASLRGCSVCFIILVPVVAFSTVQIMLVIVLIWWDTRLLCVFYNSCPCCRFQYGSDHACHSDKTLDRCVFNHSCPGHCFQYVQSGSTLVVIIPVSLTRLFTKLRCVFNHSCPGRCFQYLQSGSTLVVIVPVSLTRLSAGLLYIFSSLFREVGCCFLLAGALSKAGMSTLPLFLLKGVLSVLFCIKGNDFMWEGSDFEGSRHLV